MNTVNIVKIIDLKSQGQALGSEDIDGFIKCVFDKTIDEAQIGAFLMAVKLKGMNSQETAELTKAMAKYSYKFDWSHYEWRNKVIDKHSTGGVGDKISHVLAPLLSACGLKIPMISGRGLGITGGTIDKLESIEGFLPIEDSNAMPKMLETAGFFITGQTDIMVPVDKRLYAIRDVTATVDSIPLITASILCKKKIENIQILLMDIKFGNGTFMKNEADADELAKSIMETGKALDMNIICLIDDMNSPLGRCVGNSLEIAEVLRALNGEMEPEIKEIVYVMATELLKHVEKPLDENEIRKKIDHAIISGNALNKFKEMIILQGVSEELAGKLCARKKLAIDDYLSILKHCNVRKTNIPSSYEGYVHHIDAQTIGIITRDLGGGRKRKDDKINYDVGVELLHKEGQFIKEGEAWATIYSEEELNTDVLELLKSAITIKSGAPTVLPRIKKILISK